jgi:uncharacterized OB-fold protein
MSDAALVAAAAQLLGGAPDDATLASPEVSFQCCSSCGFLRHPAAPICPECLGRTFEWRLDSGLGSVWSFCIYHRAFDPAFEAALPYNVVLVELDSGPRIISNVLGVEPRDLHVGLRVRALATEVLPGHFLLYFASVEEAG